MTIDEAAELAKKVTFCGLFSRWTLEAHPFADFGPAASSDWRSLRVAIGMPTLDRNDNYPTTIYLARLMSARTLESHTPASFVQELHSMVREFARHEADEAFLFNGQRLFDPHAQEQGREGRA